MSDNSSMNWAADARRQDAVHTRAFGFVGVAIYAMYAVATYSTDRTGKSITMVSAGLACALFLWLLRNRGVSANLYALLGVIWSQIVFEAVRTGEPGTIAYAGLTMLPVFAGIVGNIRHVVLSTAGGLVGAVIMSATADAETATLSGATAVFPVYAAVASVGGLGYAILRTRQRRDETIGRTIRALEDAIAERDLAERGAREANAARQRFFASMSHELRNPMASLILAAESLGRQAITSHQRALLGAMTNSADSLINVLSQVLDLARFDSDGPVAHPFDIGEVIEDVVGLLAPHASNRSIELVADYRPNLPRVWLGDPAYLSRVLLNLASNAVAHTTDGIVVVAARQRGGQLALSVTDTGPGIGQGLIDSLSAHSGGHELSEYEAMGSGLGLSFVRDTVKALNGKVTVDSKPGIGTRFQVLLPLGHDSSGDIDETAELPQLSGTSFKITNGSTPARAVVESWLRSWGADLISTESSAIADRVLDLDEAVDGVLPYQRLRSLRAAVAQSPTEPSAEPPAVPGEQASPLSGRVLIVDDDEIVRLTLASMMASLGFEPLQAGDGLAALNVVQREPIDLVLLDLAMPGMSGLDFLREVRGSSGKLASMPICVVSGTALSREEVLAQGADDFLQKPSRAAELARAANTLIGTSS